MDWSNSCAIYLRPDGDEIPPAKAPLVQPSKSDSKVVTTSAKPVGGADETPTRVHQRTSSVPAELPQDYSLGRQSSGSGGRLITIGVVVVVIIGLIFVGKWLAEGDTGPKLDLDNLVVRNAGFELNDGGKPTGWRLRVGDAKIRTVPSMGRNGSSALLIEKSGDPADVLSECAFTKVFAIDRSGGVHVSAWTALDKLIERYKNAEG